MIHSAKRLLLIFEGKVEEQPFDIAADLWRGYAPALAALGLKLTLELRKRGRQIPIKRAPLEFFAMRVPKHDFDIPEWL